MMRLFVMRHGEAHSMAPTDSLRSLTEWGQIQSQQVGRWFQQREVVFDQILVSPYLRAQQTWQGVASQLSCYGSVLTEDALRPAGDVDSVLIHLESYLDTPSNNILMVSHLPMVGYLVHRLCHQVSTPMFATAAVAEIVLNNTLGMATYCGLHSITLP